MNGAVGRCTRYMRVGVWAGDVALSGFVRWVVCLGEGWEVVLEMGVGEGVRLFAGGCCG